MLRSGRRLDPGAVGAARALLVQLDLVPLSGEAFVAYDHRLFATAVRARIPVVRPGA